MLFLLIETLSLNQEHFAKMSILKYIANTSGVWDKISKWKYIVLCTSNATLTPQLKCVWKNVEGAI